MAEMEIDGTGVAHRCRHMRVVSRALLCFAALAIASLHELFNCLMSPLLWHLGSKTLLMAQMELDATG